MTSRVIPLGPETTHAIALDGGTSTTRARLVEVASGRVVASARRAVGVRDAVLGGPRGGSPVAEAVRACLAELRGISSFTAGAPIVAAGMLSAEVGLAAVPHVVAPAGLAELAAGCRVIDVPEAADEPILFIPGVRTPAGEGPLGWLDADVMRGEECETLGAMGALGVAGPAVFVWPGSHTKVVAVDAQGRIARSVTSLAGEMTTALARQTLLAKSLPEALPDEPDAEALALGLEAATRTGLGRAAFLVRIADLTGALDPARRAAFWIGAVIGDDVEHLARHAIFREGGGVSIYVGGREPQRSIYAEALRKRCGSSAVVVAIDDGVAARASALGATAAANAAGWVR